MGFDGKVEGVRLGSGEIERLVKSLNFEKLGGIIPAIAVGEDGRVLMLAFMDEEALRKTLSTGMMHYWSRSRRRLWMKGEESGHYQYVLGVYADCDSDSLLFKVRQVGNACHTGEGTCFHKPVVEHLAAWEVPAELERVVKDRIANPREGSYTSKIASGGLAKAAKKVGEEGVEAALAGVAESKERTISEAADLIYHLIILLQMKGISLEDVYSELRKRRR
ncbi:MAG: bifunctional phosphoribosyl-AMP cyclohydrolase/phosphoribosyl-ATP diphosphatase HisIE [Candidatus Methanosuratincola sp.]|jgi:phosphoribosyl-ATP pyrophosphohydrolase/phosphoribosyl-AMP cyclohydrolase|uniref:Histidine biosynthesis bifunctional protein HisIE n=1 Tax=Methanosuratincola subterraneus TaxID=2593994 RepID=A0A3S3VGV4_METS7|nr:bifunctional phosphoribosyl-AMP cyclohydrolase/phosphoribosyl-ATP diphosphatase HisIE [Candidatus Methanosuratincola sp.]RWX74230.1 MAG: Phosphoribosyl-AMP cyclohydrolase [Candidatus Methanosuratincola subterraneus]